MGSSQNKKNINQNISTPGETSQNYNTPNTPMPSNIKIIIGIDFGSSGLCFAYGRLNKKEKKVNIGYFDGQAENSKISNEIILDDELKRVLAFGNDCSSFLCSKQDFKFHHFKNIKMNLYKKIDRIKASNSDKEVDIVYIIKLILIETKKKVIEQIKKSNPSLSENDFHYIITVPAIWDIKSKQIMIDASKDAGLIREDDDFSNFFALEPEAASIYFSHNCDCDTENVYDLITKDKIEMSYILCDYGSGTVDIVTQKRKLIKNEFKFEELYQPVGGDYGANKINEYFIDRIIKPLFGEENFYNIKKELYNSEDYTHWVDFENSIEQFKITFNSLNQLNKDYTIDCEIFSLLNLDIEQKIKDFNQNNKWKIKSSRINKYKIQFPYEIIYDFMLELITKVKEIIIPITKKVNNIKTIIFSGGFSLSPILYKIFEDSELEGINFVMSEHPEIAIACGSVLFSMSSHNIISPRIAKYTFGIRVSEKWDDTKHQNGGTKSQNKDNNNNYYCTNIFEKFITKGDSLRPDDEITKIFHLNTSKGIIYLYKTEEKDVLFCDEKDEKGQLKISKFGEYEIDVGEDFDPSFREIIVKMKMGGTHISSSAKYSKTNDDAKIKCLFE